MKESTAAFHKAFLNYVGRPAYYQSFEKKKRYSDTLF